MWSHSCVGRVEAVYRKPRTSILARWSAIYPYLRRADQRMDGKGRWIDNVFIERLWRGVRYENVYLHAYENGTKLRPGLAEYCAFYDGARTHQALDYQTPDEVYYGHVPLRLGGMMNQPPELVPLARQTSSGRKN